MSSDSELTHGRGPPRNLPTISINIVDHPLLQSPPHVFPMSLPPLGTSIGITVNECKYYNMPYIVSSTYGSPFQKAVPSDLRHNIWILAIANNYHITIEQI